MMEQYDYVWKIYGADSIWNTFPFDDGIDEAFTLISYDRTQIVLDVSDSSDTARVVLGGDFTYSGPLTADNLGDVGGSPRTLKIYEDQILTQEEQYPDGISMSMLFKGGYALEMALITGNDYFAGSPLPHANSNDGIRGGDGNDTFIGYGAAPGWDQFYGEAGIDTAIFRGKISEYLIEESSSIWDSRLRDGTNATGYVVTDRLNARDDATALVEVERLQFSDVTLALDIDGIAAEAYRIYKAAFDRQPDLTGLGFWIKNMDAGMGLEAVAQEFINSAEFIRMYGANPTDEQFVDLLYANVLDRQADKSGYDFWIGALDRGLTRAGLLAEFSESRENVANVAPLIEDGIQYVAFVG
ncbi:DUF4214 domain-containing protein [Orrella daihaiensis]|uniref:DUF4214 domain-containing protein n=1 Tax=Orrella daihaiensis TaxID=2782176 RepID=A0ABY4AJD4_9BURK|nr:DUF4214 domain-containing protein [Orrella daihaiensis]UOD50406.1 DUF4214 domain-containing protein [Orrella daihaiensis]